MQFSFPLWPQQLERCSTIQQLRAQIKRQNEELGGKELKYKFQKRKEKYLYLRCCQCSAYLRFQISEQDRYLNLKSYRLAHRHILAKDNKNRRLIEFIRQLPIGINLSTAKKIAIKQLGETSSRFYYFFNKEVNQSIHLRDYLNILDQQSCQIQYEPFQTNVNIPPELLILVTPNMKRLFLKYPQVIGIDFTFKLIKDIHPSGKQWKVGMIVGNSLSRRIIPFGIVISLQQSSDTYYKLIKAFGNMMGKLPNIIVTDQTPAAKKAIQQLQRDNQYQGNHVLDIHHILANIRKKLKNKADITVFSKLASCNNRQQFQFHLRLAYQHIDISEMPILERFVQQCHLYCYSYLPNSFIGFSSNTSSNQKLNDIIKTAIPIQKPYVIVLKRLIAVSQNLIKDCQLSVVQRNPIQNYLSYPQLKHARYSLDKKIFQKLCQQFSQVPTLQLSVNQNEITVKDVIINKQFIIRNTEGHYLCNCQYSIRSGLICSHLLKVFLVNKIRLMPYINKRWMRTNIEDLKRFSFGRGKLTRRKRH